MLATDAVHVIVLVIVLAAIWLVPSWLVARYAERKGYSFVVFLIGALLVSWLLALLVGLVLPNRRTAA